MANNKIFISYRREGGAEVARLVRDALQQRGYRVFLDVEDLSQSGPFPKTLLKNIEDAGNVVVILSPDSLKRCAHPEDWLRKEVAHAFKKSKNVIPIMTPGFQWPDASLPWDIAPLRERHGIVTSHEYFDASIDRLVGMLAGRIGWWRRFRRYGLAAALVVLLALAALFTFSGLEEKPPLRTDKSWQHDQFVGIRFPQQSMGTLLAEEAYDLELEVENRTSMAMFIDKVVVEKRNPEAAKVFGVPESRVHIAEVNGPLHFKPHEKRTVTIPGNQILPMTAAVEIFHSLSGEPSHFTVDLGAVRLDMPEPRILSAGMVYRGVDALEALEKAKRKALESCAKPQVVAIFPGDSKTILDSATRLKVLVVQSWVITFFDFEKQKFYTAIVRENQVEGSLYSPKEREDLDELHPAPYPLLGNQQALDLVNRHHLICGDWQGLRLRILPVGDSWRPAWFLPYRGSDSLPLIVDALSGDLLSMGGPHGSFKRLKKLGRLGETSKP